MTQYLLLKSSYKTNSSLLWHLKPDFDWSLWVDAYLVDVLLLKEQILIKPSRMQLVTDKPKGWLLLLVWNITFSLVLDIELSKTIKCSVMQVSFFFWLLFSFSWHTHTHTAVYDVLLRLSRCPLRPLLNVSFVCLFSASPLCPWHPSASLDSSPPLLPVTQPLPLLPLASSHLSPFPFGQLYVLSPLLLSPQLAVWYWFLLQISGLETHGYITYTYTYTHTHSPSSDWWLVTFLSRSHLLCASVCVFSPRMLPEQHRAWGADRHPQWRRRWFEGWRRLVWRGEARLYRRPETLKKTSQSLSPNTHTHTHLPPCTHTRDPELFVSWLSTVADLQTINKK